MKTDKKLVIISVTSKFHLYGAFSYLLSRKILDNNLYDIIVFSNYHNPSEKFRVEENDVKNIKNILFFKKTKSISEKYEVIDRLEYKEYFIISPMSNNYKLYFYIKKKNMFCKVNFVRIDEGVGTYLSKKSHRYTEIIEKTYKKVSFLNKMEKLSKYFIKKLLDIIFISNSESFYLFKLKKNKLILNDDVAKYYKYFFKKIRPNHIINLNDKSVIIISNNLSGFLKDEKYENIIYSNIITLLKNKYYDYKIYIKPHPNEMKEINKFEELKTKFGVEVITTNISSEDIFVNHEDKIITGFTSTSLLISSQIFNIKTYLLINLIDDSYISKYGKYIIKNFSNKIQLLNNIEIFQG